MNDVSDSAPSGRVVFYEYCISLGLVTLRRPTRLYRLRPGESGLLRGLPWTALTLLLGWWGLPWGLVYTPLVLWTNLTGGKEIEPGDLHPGEPGPEDATGGRPCAAC